MNVLCKPKAMVGIVLAIFVGCGTGQSALVILEGADTPLHGVGGIGQLWTGAGQTEVLTLGDGSVASLSATWAKSDPVAAAAYVASIADGEFRMTDAFSLRSIIWGGFDPVSASEALVFWQGDARGRDEIVMNGDRGRDEYASRRGTALEWIISASYETTYSYDVPIAVVPEPSTALLGVLSGFALLRRRRS